MSEHLMQAPVLLFAGMMVLFAVGLGYCLIAEGLSESQD